MRHLKPLILSGQIKTFEDLISHSSVKEIAQAMGCEYRHVESIRNGTGRVYLRDVFGLCEALGMNSPKERGMVMELWVE